MSRDLQIYLPLRGVCDAPLWAARLAIGVQEVTGGLGWAVTREMRALSRSDSVLSPANTQRFHTHDRSTATAKQLGFVLGHQTGTSREKRCAQAACSRETVQASTEPCPLRPS